MADATYVNLGDALDYTPVADTAAGTIVNLGDGLCGIVVADIAANERGAVQIRGVIKATKAAGTGVVFGVGDQVDWDDTGNTAVATAGDFRLGVAAKAAVTGDDHVYVILNQNVATAAAV